MKVSHNVASTWTTTIETVMRVNAVKKLRATTTTYDNPTNSTIAVDTFKEDNLYNWNNMHRSTGAKYHGDLKKIIGNL